MKILVTEPDYFPEEAVNLLKNIGDVVCKKMDRKELLERIPEFDIIIARVDTAIDKNLIDRANKLKIIATPITGTNHIDMEYVEKRGIKVINAPGVNSNAVAEFTFGLILSLIRRIPQSSDSLNRGEWNRSKYIGNELKGKLVGIIGLGRIGSRIACLANSFGMNVYAYDKYVSEKDGKNINACMTTLDDLLKKTDIITVNCILTDETKNMIDFKQFNMMKKGAILVNTSRGEVVNEEALLDALKSKKLYGAALDVFSQESASNKLIEYAKNNENVIVTPHIAGSTEESMLDASLLIVEKIKECVNNMK